MDKCIEKKSWIAYGKHGPRQISAMIYSLLWLIAMCGAATSYFTSIDSSIKLSATDSIGHSVVLFVAWIYSIPSFFLVGAIYFDLKRIDHAPVAAGVDYPDWINSSLEWILRLLIMISLLVLVGKIYPNFLKDMGGLAFFYIGNVCVFILLIIWNVCAAMYRIQANKVKGVKKWDKVVTRIVLFVLAYTFPALYWYIIVREGDPSSGWVLFSFSVFYFIIVFTCIWMRFEGAFKRSLLWGKAFYLRVIQLVKVNV
jgi:hypothetical protein